MSVSQAIILAGGFGTRIRHITGETPKPMAEINGRPFLATVIKLLKKQGITEFFICSHYKSEIIEDYFKNEKSIHILKENQPLGTGGAVLNALRIIKPTGPILIMNGDCYNEVDVAEMLFFHKNNKADITLAVKAVAESKGLGVVKFEKTGRITEFSPENNSGEGYISIGFYIFEKAIIPCDYGAFSLEHQFFAKEVVNRKIMAFPYSNPFIDIGTPENFARTAEIIKHSAFLRKS